MRLLKEYTIRLVFTAGILLGVQIPNFIDQYTQKISAHQLEATKNFNFNALLKTIFEGHRVRASEFSPLVCSQKVLGNSSLISD